MISILFSRVADPVHKWKMMDNHDQETNKEIATRSSSVAKLIAATSFLVEKEALFLSATSTAGTSPSADEGHGQLGKKTSNLSYCARMDSAESDPHVSK